MRTTRSSVPSLARALARVNGKVPRDQHNTYKDYRYSSADAIFAHLRGALFDEGLDIWQDELEVKVIQSTPRKNGDVPAPWIQVTYAIGIIVSGTVPNPELLEQVTIFSQLLGPQTTAADRTFALKYYLRGKGLLDTGDQLEDADSADTSKGAPLTDSDSGTRRQPRQRRQPPVDGVAPRVTPDLKPDDAPEPEVLPATAETETAPAAKATKAKTTTFDGRWKVVGDVFSEQGVFESTLLRHRNLYGLAEQSLRRLRTIKDKKLLFAANDALLRQLPTKGYQQLLKLAQSPIRATASASTPPATG